VLNFIVAMNAIAPRGAGSSSRHWDRRPVLATVLRVLVVVVPVVLAVAATIVLGRVLPRPDAWWGAVLWWMTVLTGTLAVLVVADRILRRALPLAALYELSLVFPDRAPQRFRMWRRGGSVAQLRVELEELSRGDDARGPEAAQRVLTLVAALAVHDPRTRGHAERVRILTDMLAEEMRLPDEDRHLLRWAALLHDIGKLEVPGELLRKPAPPDAAEWEALRRHPEEGERLLGAVRGWLGPWAPSVAHHHEHFDGNGYPLGLAGDDISLGGRIVALADAFEAMTARRPYTRAVTPGAAREELVRRAGTQFDPEVCRAFLNISLGRLWRVVGLAAGVAQAPLVASFAGLSGRLRVSPGMTASAGSTAVAGTLAAVVGLLPVVGITHAVVGSPRAAVAGVHMAAPLTPVASGPAVTQPAPAGPPAGAPAPGDGGAPAGEASGVAGITAVGAGTVATAGSVAATPPGGVVVSLSVHPGSVHRDTLYAVAGTLSGCAGCTVTITWGDGSAVISVPPSGTSFSAAHAYGTKGRYRISVTAWQNGTAVGHATLRIVVNNG
jgi:putative nucleotidyltransferase with HDIG domain